MMKHRTRHLNSPSLFLAEITRCDRVREPPDAVGVVNYETRRAGRGAQKVPSYFFFNISSARGSGDRTVFFHTLPH